MIFWFEKHNKFSWIITILIAIFIFYISSLSFEPTPKGGFALDTIIYHFYAFFFLSAIPNIENKKAINKRLAQ